MSKPTLNRQLCLEILLEAEKGEYINKLIRAVLDKHDYMSREDKAFIKRICEGVVERKITLDYIIDQFSKTKASKCKPVIRNILRMGVYQIYYCDTIPNSAAINEAVSLAISKGFVNLKGFVNGVLRSIDRADRITEFPDLSVKYSVPKELLFILEKAIGSEHIEEALLHMLAPSKLFVTINSCKCEKASYLKLLDEQGTDYFDYERDSLNIGIDSRINPTSLPGYAEGLFFVQDKSSAFSVCQPKVFDGMKVLDLCAAPGGKSFYIASRTKGKCEITSCDVSQDKVELIESGINRLGLSDVMALKRDALDGSAPFEIESFDLIIADLPCSGLGVIGRKSDIKYRITQKDIEKLAKLQREILKNNCKYLKKGGQLLYSTCTLSNDENAKNAEFIEKELSLKKLFERTLLPGVDGGDGFYCSLFAKS